MCAVVSACQRPFSLLAKFSSGSCTTGAVQVRLLVVYSAEVVLYTRARKTKVTT